MSQSQRLHLLLCRVAHVGLSSTLFLVLGLASLCPVALAAGNTSQQINPQLQLPQDIPLERLDRPLRTPPVPIKPVNLNRGSIEQLVTLPGISPALAQQIIESRPYHAKTDLLEKHILPDTAYERVKNFITIE
jgi:competence protein ComEA